MSLVFIVMESAPEESGQEDIAKKYLWYGFPEELIEIPAATYAQKGFFTHCNEEYYIIVSGNVRGRYMNRKLIRGILLPQNKRD
jgi:hypothetical protein